MEDPPFSGKWTTSSHKEGRELREGRQPIGSFMWQRRQPGKGASGKKGAFEQKGAPGLPGGGSSGSSWAHSAVLGQLAFGSGLARAGPTGWGVRNSGPWYPQCPPFPDWGSKFPPRGKSIGREAVALSTEGPLMVGCSNT